MQVVVHETEWYPVLEIEPYKEGDRLIVASLIDIPEEVYEEYTAAVAAFNAVCEKIYDVLEGTKV